MKTLLLCFAFIAAQMSTNQEKPTVHFPPHSTRILPSSGGKVLELIAAPASISLPDIVAKLDYLGNPWSIDIRNLGPGVVSVSGKVQFSTTLNVGQTVHIYSNGPTYSLKR